MGTIDSFSENFEYLQICQICHVSSIHDRLEQTIADCDKPGAVCTNGNENERSI